MDIMKSNGCAFHQLTTDEYKTYLAAGGKAHAHQG